eukprot:gene29580-biopygen22117
MPTYTITELAREFDITARAIRFYEDQGLLSPSREGAGGRNRVYTPRDRTRLKLTLRGKRLGLWADPRPTPPWEWRRRERDSRHHGFFF